MLLEPDEFGKAVFYISVDRKSRFLLLYSVDGKHMMHFRVKTLFSNFYGVVSV